MLNHMTKGRQIANSDLRELARLEGGLVDQEVCPRGQLEGSGQKSVGRVVLTWRETPAVHDRQTQWQQDTLPSEGEEERKCVCREVTQSLILNYINNTYVL